MTHPIRSLYICYLSLTDPLVQTQVVAYIEGLARQGHTIHLLTFEPSPLTPAARREWRSRLRAKGIVWHQRRYHKRPSLPATLYDICGGILTGWKLIRRHRLELVHARSHVPAAMGLVLKKLTGCLLLFDIRGLLAEERADTGAWEPEGLAFRLTKALERRYIAQADALVVLTERVRRKLFPEGAGQPLQVIPCCADLSGISAQTDQRESMRAKLNLQEQMVLVYVGKFGGWYKEREMVDFFAVARTIWPDLHFLVLTQSAREIIDGEFSRHNLPPASYTVTQAAHEEIGAYLAAADFAISFIEACPSKIASSPTKLGEYLAAGLPVVCNTGVGDVDTIISEHQAGVALDEFEESNYQAAAREMELLLKDEEVRERCRQAAREHASLDEIGIPRYQELYAQLASRSSAFKE